LKILRPEREPKKQKAATEARFTPTRLPRRRSPLPATPANSARKKSRTPKSPAWGKADDRVRDAESERGDIQLLQHLLEDLDGLELQHGAFRDDHLAGGLVRIAADARLAPLHLQHAEVAQLHVATFGQRLHDDVQRHLHGGHDFLLGEAGLLVDIQDDLSFSQIGRHGVILLVVSIRGCWLSYFQIKYYVKRLGDNFRRFTILNHIKYFKIIF